MRWRRWAIAVLGVLSGLAMAFSVPSTLVFPDAEVSALFAFAGISIAVFSVLTGLVGAPRRTAAVVREQELVGRT